MQCVGHAPKPTPTLTHTHRNLYEAVGKPYLAATEGNEHAHQEMKKFFHGLCAHSSRIKSNVHAFLDLHIARKNINFAGQCELPRTARTEMWTGMTMARVKKGGEKRKQRDVKHGDHALEDTKENLRAVAGEIAHSWASASTELLDPSWSEMLAKKARANPDSENSTA